MKIVDERQDNVTTIDSVDLNAGDVVEFVTEGDDRVSDYNMFAMVLLRLNMDDEDKHRDSVPVASLSGVFAWVKKGTRVIPLESHTHVSHKE